MTRPSEIGTQARVVRLIQQRYRRSILRGMAVYVALGVALLIGTVLVENALRFTQRNLVLVSEEMLYYPVFIATNVAILYLAVTAASTMTRERLDGTLELLVYGPATKLSYLLGLFVGTMTVCFWLIVMLGLWAGVISATLNLAFGLELVGVLAISWATAGSAIALSILISSWSKSGRATIVIVVLVLVALAALQIGADIVSSIDADLSGGRTDPVGFLRQVFVRTEAVSDWISPYAQVPPAAESIYRGQLGDFARFVRVLGLSGVLLGLAGWSMSRRGAVR